MEVIEEFYLTAARQIEGLNLAEFIKTELFVYGAVGLASIVALVGFLLSRTPAPKPIQAQSEANEAREYALSSSCPRTPNAWAVGVSNGGVSVSQHSTLRNFTLTSTNPTPQDIMDAILLASYSPEEGDKCMPASIAFLSTAVTSKQTIKAVTLLISAFDIKLMKIVDVVVDESADVTVADGVLGQPLAAAGEIPEYQPAPNRVCYACRKELSETKPSQCSACKSVIYCGAECADWPNHKMLCLIFREAGLAIEKYGLHNFPFTFYSKTAPLQIYNKLIFLLKHAMYDIGLYKRISQTNADTPFGFLSLMQYNASKDMTLEAQASFLGLPLQLLPLSKPSATPRAEIVGWESFYASRGIALSDPVALVMHYPLTIFHTLQKFVVKDKEMKGERIEVHVLGAEEELDYLMAFPVLMGLFPGADIVIRMIGPGIPEQFIEVCKEMRFNQSDVDGGGSLLITFHRECYNDKHYTLSAFSTSPKSSSPTTNVKPDLIIAMNAALMAHQTWVEAVQYFVSKNARCFFTEAMQPQVNIAETNFANIGARFMVEVEVNPFRQALSLWTPDTNLPGFSNGFLFGI